MLDRRLREKEQGVLNGRQQNTEWQWHTNISERLSMHGSRMFRDGLQEETVPVTDEVAKRDGRQKQT